MQSSIICGNGVSWTGSPSASTLAGLSAEEVTFLGEVFAGRLREIEVLIVSVVVDNGVTMGVDVDADADADVNVTGGSGGR